jgi:hypothetical protein
MTNEEQVSSTSYEINETNTCSEDQTNILNEYQQDLLTNEISLTQENNEKTISEETNTIKEEAMSKSTQESIKNTNTTTEEIINKSTQESSSKTNSIQTVSEKSEAKPNTSNSNIEKPAETNIIILDESKRIKRTSESSTQTTSRRVSFSANPISYETLDFFNYASSTKKQSKPFSNTWLMHASCF